MTAFKTSAFSKLISIVLCSLLLLNTVGCTAHYKVRQMPLLTFSDIEKLEIQSRYFILHHGQNVFSLNDISLQSGMINGKVERVGKKFYYNSEEEKVYHFEKNIFNEVHIYLKEESSLPELGMNSIPLKNIKDIQIPEYDKQSVDAYYISRILFTMTFAYLTMAISKNN